MIKIIKKTIYSILFLSISLIMLVAFLVTTTSGLYTAIQIGTLFIPGTLKIHKVTGRLLDKFSIGAIEYHYQQNTIRVQNLSVQWNLKTLMQRHILLEQLNAQQLEINADNSSHILKRIRIQGKVNQQRAIIDSLQFNYLDHKLYGQFNVALPSPHLLSGKIRLNPYTKKQEMLHGILDIGGDINQLQWAGNLAGPAPITFHGTLKDQATLYQIIKWRDVAWPPGQNSTLNSPEGRIKITGTLPSIKVELKSKIKQQKDNWQLSALLEGTAPWHWNITVNMAQPVDTSAKHEGLYTAVIFKGALKDSNKGSFTFNVAPGLYQMAEDGMLPMLPFTGGQLKITLSPQKLAGNGSLTIDPHTQIKIHFNLPKFDLAHGVPDTQKISAELSLLFSSFDFLKNLSPDISNPKGQLTASLKASGTMNNLRINSQLNLAQASIGLPKLGLNLDSIDLNVIKKKEMWEAKGSISSANKKLIIKGQGPLNGTVAGDLSLQGNDFPLMNTKEYQITASPQLQFKVTPTNLNINGSVLIPHAQIKPETFSNSLVASEDIVFKTAKVETPPSLFTTSMNLRVEMGETVELTFKGLHALLAGAVDLNQKPQGPINANGELTVKKGEYKAYGQDLAISQGELIFTGGQLDNPGISVRAEKKINTSSSSITSSNQLFDFNNNNLQNANVRGNIIVGVEVTGRLVAPKIQLFSNPAILSQADILSMLVLGRPASQANKAGGQLLLAAISSMNLGTGTGGAQLLDQLKQNLGVDFNVQTNSNYNLVTNQVSDNTAFVVGKALSKRIYLSYNVGLAQADPNVLTLKYLLNKFLSIQVSNSDSASGIDFLYTSSK